MTQFTLDHCSSSYVGYGTTTTHERPNYQKTHEAFRAKMAAEIEAEWTRKNPDWRSQYTHKGEST